MGTESGRDAAGADTGPASASRLGTDHAKAASFRAVSRFALALFVPQVLTHVAAILWLTAYYRAVFNPGQLARTALMSGMDGRIAVYGHWMALGFAVADVLLFWAFYLLARRYRPGLLLIPLFTVGVLMAPALYVACDPRIFLIGLVR